MDHKKTQIKVDRLALDGDGIGRLSSGEAAFVPYTLPTEIVSCRLLVQKKNHSRWLPDNVVQPSAQRIDPPCPSHFRPGRSRIWCGGCNWQHMPTKSQEEAKRQLVIETLIRLGGLTDPQVAPTIASPLDWRYRNKVQVPFGQKGKTVVAGFFAPGSHEIVEFEDCPIQPPLSVDIVLFVKRYANDHRWHAYEEDAGKGWIRHLLVRTNEKGEALVLLVTAAPLFPDKNRFVSELRKKFPAVIGVHQNVQPARTNVILGRKWIPLWGKTHIIERILGLGISYSAGSFFQVNKGAAERLYAKAIEELSIDQNSIVLDLYCGVGALTLLAAKKARFSIGVEPISSAIRDAKENAKWNRISNVEFIEQDSEKFLRSERFLEKQIYDARCSLVIIDPPRSGCSQDVLDGLLRFKPARIVYVSCHPATLARDLKILSSGYTVASVTPVDLFPQTSHIEAVVRLERRPSHL